MPLILLILGPALLLLGGIAAVLGWRGRCLDDHPVCRKCRFDLFGTPEPRTECPECGAALDEAKAIRTGNRKRRTGWMVGGLVAFLFGGTGVGILASDIDFNPYKPFWLLRVEATSPSLGSKGGALRELERRLQNRALTTTQMNRLMDTAVQMQTSHPPTWDRKWTDIFWQLHGQGAGTAEQYQHFIEEGLTLEFEVRPRIEIDEPIICRVISDSSRILNASRMLYVDQETGTVSINGIEWPWKNSLYMPVLHGGRSSTQAMSRMDRGKTPLINLQPGEYSINVRLTFPIHLNHNDASPFVMVNRSFDDSFELVKDGDAPIELYRDEVAIKLIEAEMTKITGQQIELPMAGGSPAFWNIFRQFSDLPGQSYAYRIVAKSGDNEWILMEYIYPEGYTDILGKDYPDVGMVDLVIRPAPDVAKKTTHIERILDHEFTIKDVEVVWED